jgi:nickel superoxide dismutase
MRQGAFDRPVLEATAHYDLPSGLYDLALARIETESATEKTRDKADLDVRSRAGEIH